VSKVVLDASALLALVNQEPGQAVVAELLPRSLVSVVNASELVAKLTDQGMPENEIQDVLVALNLTVSRWERLNRRCWWGWRGLCPLPGGAAPKLLSYN
jgi:PIN domain nuclease of toxin-antitoxin system